MTDQAYLLRKIPKAFVDDGCTRAPDRVFGYDLRFACRIHDWRYCTRCHVPGTMDTHHRNLADTELRDLLREVLPWRWRFLGWVYWLAVWQRGGFEAWDSCGLTAGECCRHGMPVPEWMVV